MSQNDFISKKLILGEIYINRNVLVFKLFCTNPRSLILLIVFAFKFFLSEELRQRYYESV